MNLTPSTQPSTEPTPLDRFVWEPAGKRIAVHLSGEAFDQINRATMRGFGALPKRGAEVGGLLLGSVETGEKTVVRIDEFLDIPCAHLYGPSYTLCEDDLPALEQELAAHSAHSGARLRVVGFFRSHTRDPIQLDEADLALLDARFLYDEAICLLVKPFATRPSEAVFLTREEDGQFSVEPQTETYVFRRKEMQLPPAAKRERAARSPERVGEPSEAVEPLPAGPPATTPLFAQEPEPESNDLIRMGRLRTRRSPSSGVRLAGSATDPSNLEVQSLPTWYGEGQVPMDSADTRDDQTDAPERPIRRYRWVWLWLPLAFMVLGGFIGVAIVLTIDASQNQGLNADPYDLRLSVSQVGESYELKWNPQMPALREARSGELVIEEGTVSKRQPLSGGDLARGSVIYRGASAPVRFRLSLFLRGKAVFTETLEAQPGAR